MQRENIKPISGGPEPQEATQRVSLEETLTVAYCTLAIIFFRAFLNPLRAFIAEKVPSTWVSNKEINLRPSQK